MSAETELGIVAFSSAKEWKQWLAKNHARSNGIWLRLFKRDSAVSTVSYDEALDEALCCGWIDGQLKRYDERSWLRKFTPRRPKSVWSKRNRERAERLAKAGKMRAAGVKEIEAAKQDGRWNAAYDPASKMRVPDDLRRGLAENTRAHAFYTTLNRTNVYAIAWRLQTAKTPGTRQKRLTRILAMLAQGQTFHG
ncbi:MAG TPA: YdeI/OmpD-associated family protein [bacterium]|nr:YdeI/OmpD-associated family protein [bacterium]